MDKMQIRKYILIISITTLVSLNSCSKPSEVVNPPISEINLLQNSSFEVGGVSSLDSWTLDIKYDTSGFSYSNDVATGSGNFSICIKNNWPVPVRIYQTAQSFSGSHVYRVDFWAKDHHSGGGVVYLGLKTTDTIFTITKIVPKDTTWTNYSYQDTVLSESGDSLLVVIRGGFYQPSRIDAKTYFDNVQLIKLN